MHGVEGLLQGAALLVGSAFLFVSLCIRLRLPTLLGYLAAGLIIGPSGLGLISEAEVLSHVGEVGVVLLLFALGLEFSFSKIKELRRLIFGAGLVQVATTTGLVAGGALIFSNVSFAGAILLGGAVAMSSTALCLKLLAGKQALGYPEGRAAIAILLFQDLAAVAFLLIHDAALGSSLIEAVMQMALGAAVLVLALFISRRLLQRVANVIANANDPEPAQLMALALALGASLGAIALGLSPALGAFAAGMIISESDARNVVEREIRPFRDLFVGVFFVAIGTQFHLDQFVTATGDVILWFALLVVFKPAIVALALRLSGEPIRTAIRSALILGQGGEFGLVLLTLSLSSGLLSADQGAPLVLAIVLSMLASVPLFQAVMGREDER